MSAQKRLRVVPLTLLEANSLVSKWHRHHRPTQGHKFSLGVITPDGTFHGAAIAGHPVARLVDQRQVLEVTRLVTDGTANACSALYAAAARAGKAMGYTKIQTYILESESGASLRAAGWHDEGETGGGDWSRKSRVWAGGKRNRTDQPMSTKRRYAAYLNDPLPDLHFAAFDLDDNALTLFDDEIAS